MIRLENTGFQFSTVCCQGATLWFRLKNYCSLLKLLIYLRGELLQSFNRDQLLLWTSFDQSSEIPPYAEGYRDAIDDEVISFSYSYTVVILCQDVVTLFWLHTSISVTQVKGATKGFVLSFFALSIIQFLKFNTWLEERCGYVYFCCMMSGIKNKSAKRYKCTCQIPYSSII